MEEKISLKTKIVILSLIIVGLLLLIISIAAIEHEFWNTFINSISTALVVTGVWNGINQYVLRKDFVNLHNHHTNRIIQSINLSETAKDVGITNIYPTADQYDYKPIIKESERLTILLNDGRTWLNWNSESMQERFMDSKKETTFIFLHPESEFLEVMAHKVHSTVDILKSKLNESLHMLKDIKKANTNLKVYGHKFFNCHSIFMNEDIGIVTPYTISRARKVPVVFEYLENTNPNCYYLKIKDDIKVLLQDCEELQL